MAPPPPRTNRALSWKASITGLIFMTFTILSLSSSWSISVPQEPGNWIVTTRRAPAGRRHTYGGMLPCAPKGLCATLLSPPQCHSAFGTMPHTLASLDHSPVRRPRTFPSSAAGTPENWICGGGGGYLCWVDRFVYSQPCKHSTHGSHCKQRLFL
jgi:hypothetical protein